MRVLLVGASSALGTHLIPRLIDGTHEVVGITRRSGSLAGTGASEVIADVMDRKKLLAALQWTAADAVVSLLGSAATPPSTYRAARRLTRLRMEGTSTLIAAARRIGAQKFVATSPVFGYGLRDHGDAVLDETSPFGEPDGTANDAILLGVLSAEQQVRAFGGIVLRTGLPYASGASEVPPTSLRWGGQLPLIHAADAADAVVRALDSDLESKTYNIVDDAPMTWRELQKAQAAADGFRPPVALPAGFLTTIAPFASQLITRTSLVLANDHARNDLGWAPAHPSLHEGLPTANIRG